MQQSEPVIARPETFQLAGWTTSHKLLSYVGPYFTWKCSAIKMFEDIG